MIREGTKVKWSWGNGSATGKVVELYHEDVSVTIDSSQIKRQASENEPAYLIEQSDGQKVLKSSSEVERA